MKNNLFLGTVLALASASPTLFGLELTLRDGAVVVPAGGYEVGGRTITVAEAAVLPMAPARIVAVTNEPVKISAQKPGGRGDGSRLRGPQPRDINAAGWFIRGSLEMHSAEDGMLLTEGDDYLLDPVYGHVGLGPRTSLAANDTVFVSYRYGLLRMDTVEVSPRGIASLISGKPHVSAPVPPEADAGSTAIAHILVRPEGTSEIWPIIEEASQAVTLTTPGRIPKTLAKLKAGKSVKIVCLGDSVTAGGNASEPDRVYVEVFAAGLRKRFPAAKIEVENISVGATNSRRWLFPEEYPFHGRPGQVSLARFTRVIDAKPDLVTIEFVNDAGLDGPKVEANYGEILNRLKPLGAEVILITPHFTMMMGPKAVREGDRRPYVLGLKEFAERHHVALADASGRWEHLWKEGIPYMTLLDNTINHPDDRGHRIFAEELWKCFQ